MAIKYNRDEPIRMGTMIEVNKEPFDPDFLMHDDDRKALAALKAIPGFGAFLKAFMNVWNERQFQIINMSSNIRLGKNQMSRYYDMLYPICDKLKIDVPELYITLDVVPNAYTYGDTKPFITITSGLLDIMPDRLLPTVLAHECGHIACHHVLYRTMGAIILNSASLFGSMTAIGQLITVPLQVAFYHWIRSSELSADRVAAYCDRTTDNVIEMCMRLAGYGKNMNIEISREAFLSQADEYKEMISNSRWNKTMEFILVKDMTHPFNAVRANECREWGLLHSLK